MNDHSGIVDSIVVKYIGNMPESGFDQLSLCRGVNDEFILNEMPQIRYDLVELYW